MESFELGLVRKLCLVAKPPHRRSTRRRVQEIRFYVTHHEGPSAHGLLDSCSARGSTGSSAASSPGGRALLSARAHRTRGADRRHLAAADGGFEYSDAYLHDNDARFVWNFVRRALD